MSYTSLQRKTLRAWPLAGLAALVALPLSAQAQDRSWQVADGAWNVPGNWIGGVPTIPASAWINNSGTARVGAGIAANANSIHVGSTNGGGNTFSLEGGTFISNVAFAGEAGGSRGTFSVSSGTWVNTSSIVVGSSGTAHFLMSGGYVSTAVAQLGGSPAGAGVTAVTGGTFSVTSPLIVGGNGTGSLSIGSTGLVTSGTTIVATGAGSSGTITLSGTTFLDDITSSGTLVTGQVMSGSGQGTFHSSGGTLRLTQNQSALFDGFQAGDVTIGSGGLTIDTANYNVGIATGIVGTGTLTKMGSGTLTLTGSNSYGGGTDYDGGARVKDGTLLLADGGSLSNGGYVLVSGSQNAALEVKDGSVSVYGIEVARQGVGTLSISGSNTRISSTEFIIGRSGTGTMNLSSGYVSSGRAIIASGDSGTALVTGGTWAVANDFNVGWGGAGDLQISGGLVSSGSAIICALGDTSTALVSGGTWNVSSSLTVGRRGNATLTISGTGLMNAGEVILGGSIQGTGILNLNGGVLATGSIIEGSGTGTANLNGGLLRLTQNQAALFDGFEAGDVTIGGGGFFLDTAGYNAGIATSLSGTGALTKVGSGTLTLTGSHGYTGGTTVRDGTLLVDGGSLNHSGGIYVSGSAGQNALMEVRSGSVSVSAIEVGNGISGVGTLSISGSDARVSAGYLRLGDFGTGTLNLSSGYLASGTAVFGAAGGQGIATVTGGTWSMGSVVMGYRGSGSLTISNGLVTADYLEVARDKAAALVVDGGRLEIGALRVGGLSGGSFVLNSGTVTSDVASIASTSSGSATITGGTWTMVNSLDVGFGGNGLLDISGGVVSSAESIIGRFGNGTALVSGGTWNTSGLLTVGGMRLSSLSVSGSGRVNAQEVLVAPSGTATLSLNGGLLATAKVSSGTGLAGFNFNGGTLRATGTSAALVSGFTSGIDIRSGGAVVDSNGYDVAITSAFTGSGAFTKIGTGALTLTGTSTYSGGTKIEAGTLIISDLGASASVLGTGDVTVGENGKLAGVGTVLGDTFVAGTLAPGNSPGEMNFAGNLFLESTAVVQMELASATVYDQITVGGLLTYDGTLSITLLGGYVPQVGDTFTLFDAANVASGSQFDSIIFGDSGYTGTLDYTTGILTVTAVPEPTAAALLVLGAAGLLARRRVRS